MKTAAVLASLLVLAGCSAAEPVEPETITETTTEAGPAKAAVDGLELDRDNYNDRFVLEHKQWLDEVYAISLDEDNQEFEVQTVMDRPYDSDVAVEMCNALIEMAKGDGLDSPKVEVLSMDDALMARGGYNASREGCNPV